MNNEEFKNEFVEALKEKLSERGNDVDVKVSTVEKMNQSYEAITITPEGSNIGMNMNLEVFAKAYESGVPFDEIVEQVTNKVEAHLADMPTFDVQSLTDYEQMKDKLAMEVVAADRNADLLAKVPHQEMEDMAVVYRFVMDSDENGRASILVSNDLLDKMGVTPEQLHADALENAPELRPAVIKGMSEVMMDMMGEDAHEMFGIDEFPQDEMMYVATVPDKISGAGVIAYQEFMDQAAEKLGGDFYILPSSIHEVLLVKDDGAVNFNDLKSMVEDVNATQVAPEEKLTDSVYHYDSKEHIFELAEKFELNPNLKIEGILLTMVDNRTNYAKDICSMVNEACSSSIKVFKTEIPMSVRAAEVSVEGSSIYKYDPKGKAAYAYGELTKEVLNWLVQRIINIRCTSRVGEKIKLTSIDELLCVPETNETIEIELGLKH